MTDFNDIFNKVKNKYVPDKRVGIFNIEFSEENGELTLKGESDNPKAVNELIEELSKKANIKNEVKILPDKDLGDKIYGIVNVSVANIRSNPKHPAELATQSLLGTVVKILKKQEGWFLIQTPDEYISWVDDDAILPTTKEENNNWKEANKIIVTSNYSNSFSNPDVKSEKVSDLVLGDILKLVSKENNFTKVEYPDQRIAFVKNSDVKNYSNWLVDSISTAETIIATAKEMIGLPYLWGGTSSKGVDCSGFTKTSFYMNGVVLPRDASQQVNIGETVNTENGFENLEPGDLLFFGQKKTEEKPEKITHVALYLGDGKYLHAAGRVQYNSLFEKDDDFNKYRYETFIRAKRVIGSFDKGENLVKNHPYYK